VLPDGTISVNLLPAINVTGMTTDELAQLLSKKWDQFVVRPSVSVSIFEKRKENVLVYGYVLHPGIAEYKPPMRVLDALGTVGGALLVGDLRRTTLTRKTGEKLVLDLRHPDRAAGTAADVELQAGDVVYIPEKHNKVSVVGMLKAPGDIDFHDDMTVDEAITQVGGINFDAADLSASTVERDGKEIPIDLEAFYRHGDKKANITLQEGDRILVPEVKNRTYVFGAVRLPGFYPYKENYRVTDALTLVGGPIAGQADLGDITLIRPAADKKSATKQVVNLQKFLQGKEAGNYKYNPELQPGDVLYVPDRKHKLGTQDIWNVLGGFGILRNALLF
jgi:polysaccharide export outer membrane protein